jgi:cobyrinic acid a,c-diamide synthase
VPAAERTPEALATVERLGHLVAQGCDLEHLLQIAYGASDLTATPWTPPAREHSHRPRVALGGGAAFTFAYAEMAECLSAAGAEVVVVDPLHDERLPEGTAALVLPGGFPEVYAQQLTANRGFLEAVRGHLQGPGPTYAECAGLLMLCKSLDQVEMIGHFDALAEMTPSLTLGYRTVVAEADTLVAGEGTAATGHEFHRTVVEPRAGVRPAWRLEDGTCEGFTTGTRVVASYVHLHPASVPSLVRNIVGLAAGS